MKKEIRFTPENMAERLVNAVLNEYLEVNYTLEKEFVILDPNCKNGLILAKFNKQLKKRKNTCLYGIGIFEENDIIDVNRMFFNSKQYSFISKNYIIPSKNELAYDYWKHRIKRRIGCIVSDLSDVSGYYIKNDLKKQESTLMDDGFDSCISIIELCIKLIEPGGVLGFIVPSSLFLEKNRENTVFLSKNLEIKGISHLYSYEFCNFEDNISIIVLKKRSPM